MRASRRAGGLRHACSGRPPALASAIETRQEQQKHTPAHQQLQLVFCDVQVALGLAPRQQSRQRLLIPPASAARAAAVEMRGSGGGSCAACVWLECVADDAAASRGRAGRRTQEAEQHAHAEKHAGGPNNTRACRAPPDPPGRPTCAAQSPPSSWRAPPSRPPHPAARSPTAAPPWIAARLRRDERRWRQGGRVDVALPAARRGCQLIDRRRRCCWLAGDCLSPGSGWEASQLHTRSRH